MGLKKIIGTFAVDGMYDDLLETVRKLDLDKDGIITKDEINVVYDQYRGKKTQ